MIFPVEEEEEEEEEEEDEVSFRHITSPSLREGRWTSQGGVRISSASRDTFHRSELFLVHFLHLSHAANVLCVGSPSSPWASSSSATGGRRI